MNVERRKKATNDLIERYVQARGETPSPALLERLANVILSDELGDKTKRRKSNDRPPIYTDAQLMRQGTRSDRHSKAKS
jgi:hypothetical protein